MQQITTARTPAGTSGRRNEPFGDGFRARAAGGTMLRVRGLAVGFGGEPILDGIDLDVAEGEFATLVGPSGSGKTSILRVVTGLLEPLRGTVALDAGPRDVGFLFQDDALLPWRTARQNVALGLRIREVPPAAADERAEHWLSVLGLAGLGDRYPAQLSGGQRKRVAIAQVLALRPRVLLMDEPFAALDAIVRTRITQELLGWVERERLTVVLVTHDLEEAIGASDVVHVLGAGPRASIRARHRVAIPRPRRVLEARGHPSFGPLLQRLWADLDPQAAAPDEAGEAAPQAAAPDEAGETAPRGAAPDEAGEAVREGAVREGTAREGTAREAAVREGAVREGTAREGTAREAAAREGAAPEGAAPGAPAP